MKFKTSEQIRCTGTTPKGNTIEYNPLPVEKLKTYSNDIPAEKNICEWENSSRIVLECSFAVTGAMADLLESSKILFVERFSNNKDTQNSIEIVPRALFDYSKLNDILFDLCQRFDL